MTVVQPPRHRAPSGAQGFGREPHPSGPVTVAPRRSRSQAAEVSADAPTMPIPRAALDAARAAAAMPMGRPLPAAPVAPMAAPRNGLGIAGLVLGLCGLVVGLIPLFGFGAILLGVVGLVLGLVGVTRARRRVANNIKTAVSGVIASVLAIALGITGMVIVANAFTQLDQDLSALGAGTPPAAVAAPASTAVGFGQTFTYTDGLAVTVSEPTSFDPSRYAAGNTNPHAYKVTVRVTNNTGQAFDPTMLQVAMSTGGAPGSQIFDSQNGMGERPQNQLQPGRSLTYELAFSTAANTGEAQVDVTPSFSYNPAVFTGTL